MWTVSIRDQAARFVQSDLDLHCPQELHVSSPVRKELTHYHTMKTIEALEEKAYENILGKEENAESDLSQLYRTIILVGSNHDIANTGQLAQFITRSMATSTWGYTNENGPHTWAHYYPEAAGHGQSPVDIETKDAVYDSELAEDGLTIKYGAEEEFVAENNGLSFKVQISKPSELSGGPLKDKYRLEQFHLHWGSSDEQGSEHTIDRHSYAAELHLVHWNCSKYSSFGEAAKRNDGLAVLGIMIEAGSEHKGFKVLSETARSIKYKQKCRVAAKFNPICLLPSNTTDFWTYHGSLTTPPCFESVQWIVFKDSVQYSPQQLTSLRNLMDSECDGHCIVNNYRPPLPLGDRKIRCSFH